MIRVLTEEQARRLFYGGTVLFGFLFLALSFDTSLVLLRYDPLHGPGAEAVPAYALVLGKALWEQHDCIGCHSLAGEGAYFAPELSNVYQRYNNSQEAIKSAIRYHSFGTMPKRRSMPKFNFTKKELNALVEFLKYSSNINTAHWPPHQEG